MGSQWLTINLQFAPDGPPVGLQGPHNSLTMTLVAKAPVDPGFQILTMAWLRLLHLQVGCR